MVCSHGLGVWFEPLVLGAGCPVVPRARGSIPMCVWRRCPTLPHPGECSTIGAGRLSFRVRNGTGRFPAAMTTVTLYGFCVCMLIRRCGDRLSHSGRKQEVYNPHHDAHGEGVCCRWSAISTSQLHPLPGFHIWPINPMVCGGPHPTHVGGRIHLEAGFPLRCFQRLSFPNVANQPCHWRDNWHTRGSSVPVLSY